MRLPSPDEGPVILGAVCGAFAPTGGLDPLQTSVLATIAQDLFQLDLGVHPLRPLAAVDLVQQVPDLARRESVVSLVALLEMVAHPLSPATAASVSKYAAVAGVDNSVLHAARHLADRHIVLMYADLQRSSWFTHETVHGALHGRFVELARSKMAYSGIVPDQAIGRKWHALDDCPEGSWGKGVADFYSRHHFPFPGERHGISEVGAQHDFVHVLADYDATPAGEIDVFAFIAASMPEQWGLAMLAFTLGLFQNGAIHHVAGKRVRIARSDTLSDPGEIAHFSDALRRGAATVADVMDATLHFSWAGRPLEDVRSELNVVPREA